MIKKISVILCCMFYSIYAAEDNFYGFQSIDSTTLETQVDNSISQLENTLRVDSDSGISLKELLNSANSNYSLQAQDLLTKQARKNHLISMLAVIPTLDVSYNYNKTDTSVPLDYQTQNAKINFNLKVDWADYNSIREKGASVQQSVYDNKYAKENIYLQVIQQYYTYFSNQSKLLSLQHQLEQLQSDVDRVQKLYNQGLKTIADLESLKSQASTTEYQIEDAKFASAQSKLMLEYLTNLKIDKIKRVQIKNPTYTLESRSDIKSLEYQITAQKFQNRQLHYYPVLNLTDTYTYNIEVPSFVASMMGSGAVSGLMANYATHNNVFGIAISYPLFAKIGLTAQKQSYTLAQLANEKTLAYKKNEQKKDEELYRMAIEVAKNQVKSAKASLVSANLSYDNMKKRYDANLITFTEYLQALSTKYDAESTFIQALNNYEIQKANYIFYSGQELIKYVNE